MYCPKIIRKKHIRNLLLFPVFCVLMHTGTLSAFAADPLCTYTGFYFDTVISISLYDTDDQDILDECDELMKGYENTLSRTLEGSEIWQINHSGGKPVTVSETTADLIRTALTYCELSEGAFDITIAPVIDLWDFHQENDPMPPDPQAVSEALSHVGYEKIKLTGNEVTLADPESGIDLGAIAKGFISDGVKELLLSRGVKSAMINLGGNVMTIGEKPDGSLWKIGIREPFAPSASDLAAVVPVDDQSVITSGTYERYFLFDNHLYHHILDPSTGYSYENGLTSVTILSVSGTAGDALSTTCFALGLEKGLELIENTPDTEALFITEDRKQYTSSGWPG